MPALEGGKNIVYLFKTLHYPVGKVKENKAHILSEHILYSISQLHDR